MNAVVRWSWTDPWPGGPATAVLYRTAKGGWVGACDLLRHSFAVPLCDKAGADSFAWRMNALSASGTHPTKEVIR